MSAVGQTPVFRDLSADDPDPEVTEIESLCVNCFANGSTRLMMTRIPFFKNVVIMSFSCEECGYQNNELQLGGAHADCGVRWTLHVTSPVDLNRQLVKSDYTAIRIPELDLEIPVQSQKGEVTTVEGVLDRITTGLSQQQALRSQQHPEVAAQIDTFIDRVKKYKDVTNGGFTLELEDISGNCFIENPEAPKKDPRCSKTEFKRTKEQDHILGIFTQEEISDCPADGILSTKLSELTYEDITGEEVMTFRTNCPECNAPADTNMKLTKIPHFKEVVIMATTCDGCGHRTNEVKSGGGIEKQGVRFEVKIRNKEDFSRDILKSETCSLEIPELDLEVGGCALGGRFTTTEGILEATIQQLQDSPGAMGDAPGLAQDNIATFVEKVREVLRCERSATLVLDDPAGNSYVQSLNSDPNLPDDGLKISHYERTFEQNEELGLNDIKTEGYEQA